MTTPANPADSVQASMSDPYRVAQRAAEALRPQLHVQPRVAIVLGTGLGGLADRIADAHAMAYAEIPHFPVSTVQGHVGRLVVGTLAGVPVAALQGRFHLYEGYSPAQVVHPVRVLAMLGARLLVVTNAAGGLNPDYHAGDLMLLRDHIGIPALAGLNPLVGMNDERYGPRFPAMTRAYDVELRAHTRAVAGALGTKLAEGVYVMVSGPSYETPAELGFLRSMGADAVGMSSVPEVIAGRHLGLRVVAISCITNLAIPQDPDIAPAPSHQEVVDTAQAAGTRLADLIEGLLARLRAHADQALT
jgi:purine-nucleoside phosphorylase